MCATPLTILQWAIRPSSQIARARARALAPATIKMQFPKIFDRWKKCQCFCMFSARPLNRAAYTAPPRPTARAWPLYLMCNLGLRAAERRNWWCGMDSQQLFFRLLFQQFSFFFGTKWWWSLVQKGNVDSVGKYEKYKFNKLRQWLSVWEICLLVFGNFYKPKPV